MNWLVFCGGTRLTSMQNRNPVSPETCGFPVTRRAGISSLPELGKREQTVWAPKVIGALLTKSWN